MKQLLLSVFAGLMFSATAQYAADTRNDSVSAYHYEIRMDFSNFSVHTLRASARIGLVSKVNNLTSIRFDLKGPDTDSVHAENGDLLTFQNSPESVTIQFDTPLNVNDSTEITIFYSGTPTTDPQFGGFYWTSAYAFNVGVSLTEIPHNYGKTWFPCIDDFVNRSTFEYFITTIPAHEAVCGGVFIDKTFDGNGNEVHHYRSDQTMPAYLASVGVSDYTFIDDTYAGISGNVPLRITARPTDVVNVNNSFAHLHDAFDIFEDAYGPYRWDRVGYELCTISGGAMEHAMNVAYPVSLANGSLTYESVMAHELSHHWWGNLVTCRTAEDMWINEGSAAYCEFIFTEQLNGRAAYESSVKQNHKNILYDAHLDDDGFWPLSGMPQEHTYGTTTYSKGADVLHTLRSYLGDASYFSGTQNLLTQNAFSDMDAWEYRDKLSAITGYDLTNFFDTWIFQGGWPHVAIDSFSSVPAGSGFDVTIYLKQKLRARNNFSDYIPMKLTMRDASWQLYETQVVSTGEFNQVTVNVPFQPDRGWLNDDAAISHAATSDHIVLHNTGSHSLPYSYLQLNVQSISDSVLLVVDHNWVSPEPATAPYALSTQRYWNVDGIWPAGFDTKAIFRFSGTTSGGMLTYDDAWMGIPEDSVRLMYRPSNSDVWTEVTDCTYTLGSSFDKTGNVTVNHLQRGQYTFAMRGGPMNSEELKSDVKIELYPNPSGNELRVKIPSDLGNGRIEILTIDGKPTGISYSGQLKEIVALDVSHIPAGAYLCRVTGEQTATSIRFTR